MQHVIHHNIHLMVKSVLEVKKGLCLYAIVMEQ